MNSDMLFLFESQQMEINYSDSILPMSYRDNLGKNIIDNRLYYLVYGAKIYTDRIRDVIVPPINADINEEFELFKHQLIPVINQAITNHGNRLFIYFLGNLFCNPHDTETINPCGQLLEYLFELLTKMKQLAKESDTTNHFGLKFIAGPYEMKLYQKGIISNYNVVKINNELTKYTFNNHVIISHLSKNDLNELLKGCIYQINSNGELKLAQIMGQYREIILTHFPLINIDSYYHYVLNGNELTTLRSNIIDEHIDYFEWRELFKTSETLITNIYASNPCLLDEERCAVVKNKCSININNNFIRNDNYYIPSKQKQVVYIIKYNDSRYNERLPICKGDSMNGTFNNQMTNMNVKYCKDKIKAKLINTMNIKIEKCKTITIEIVKRKEETVNEETVNEETVTIHKSFNRIILSFVLLLTLIVAYIIFIYYLTK